MAYELNAKERIIVSALVMIVRFMGRFTVAHEEALKKSLDEIMDFVRATKE